MTDNGVELDTNNQILKSPSLKRTKFFVSFFYLIIQVLLPGLVLFFLTAKDFNFTFKLPLWLMFVLSLALFLFTIITTFITYKLKLHQIDQFTYVVPFVCFFIALYLTSYWLSYHYFLIRFVIAFACAVVGIFFTSVVLLLILRKNKLKGFY